jgi:hypothetical protein
MSHKIKTQIIIKNRTLRHCLTCKKNTYFEYNPTIQHSRCTQCQQSYSGAYKDIEQFKEQIINYLNHRIEHITTQSNLASNKERIYEINYLIEHIKKIEYKETT